MVMGRKAEIATMCVILRRALASLYELHPKTGMIEFWGECDDMPLFIHHPVKRAEADIAAVLSTLRDWEEQL